ncbi:MAG TPA: NAD(P)H-dependent glycerol-3-phosphate dehydrogenase [Cellulomonas sp.]
MTRAAVVGTGAWGTTFAQVLADAGCDVTLWGRDEALCRRIDAEHRNDAYLPGVTLPAAVRASSDAAKALAGAELVAVAVPVQIARAVLDPMAGAVPAGAPVVSLMKGVELATDRRTSQLLAEALVLDDERVAVLSGPNLAREIAARQPTATVVASTSDETAAFVARSVQSWYFRPYTSPDVVGVELCGAVKNVIALAVGISQGRGFGYNTMATLVTRGLAEIRRLGLRLGADGETFSGLAGAGDLMATCASPLSRNHSLGVLLGQGAGLDEAVARTQGTAEGVKTSRAVAELAVSLGVEMPITQAVVRVLFEGLPVDDLASLLLGRPMKDEAADRPLG